jgi:hypothetical protein
MQSSPTRIPVVLVVALLVVLVASAGAGAFSITSVSVTPQAPSGPLPASGPSAAGAHPNLLTTIDFSDSGNPSADTVRDLALHYAPGIVAYVNHLPRCSQADFDVSAQGPTDAAGCSASTIVGSSSASTTANVLGIPTPLPVTGSIYNLEPSAGTPAALAVDIPVGLGPVTLEHLKFIIPIGVDPHDLGLNASLSGLPNSAPTVPNVHTDSLAMTLFGYVGGASFFTSPTACIPAAISVTATSYANATSTGSGSYTPTDCAHEPFSTSLTISANPSITDSPSAISADVKPGGADVPRVNSHVKSDTVTLPPGVLINPALAARLQACTDAGFKQSDTSVAANCPASSAVGDITFVSPILGAFPGKAYFGTQTPTDRLRLFLDVPLYGAHIKVSAHVHPDFTTGQITTVFDQLPQIAFTDFQLTFHGGPQSALVTPTTCGSHTAAATVFPWSGGAAASSTASFTTSYDGKGAACRSVFGPSFTTSVSDDQSGASPSSFTLTANRPDRNVPIGRMTFELPAGFVGDLALKGLTQCPLSVAAAGDCPASSRLGPVRAVAGSGSEPPTLPGSIYLTKPKAPGDPAGLSVVVPAHLGPVDAGVVIVGVRLQLRPSGGLTATSDPIPALQQGIPLALRQLAVTIDRKGFMRNPTSCGTTKPLGHFESLSGGTANVNATLTFKGCERLPFKPRFSVRLGARHRTGAGSHPPLTTTIAMGPGQAAIRRAHVTLPLVLAANLTAVNAACDPAALAAGTCSKHALAGSATAVSPLVSQRLSGPVYLVKTSPGKLPKLVVQLHGPLSISFEGFVKISASGQLSTTFPAVPDLPVSRFTLSFHSGHFGVLTATKSICRRTLRLASQFTGHNGRSVKLRPKIVVSGCPKPRHHTHRR